ncbi:carboxypeptidase M32 [Novosphingobium sp. Gsoil 351]|uniref:carboxypeptidase M32 n=1 Tax=Novosphingobium sp. Gsoil 351 TaxID=2675225 RepID=UPI0018A83D01|nr:carboxypeptidase M32 [Novosphingobium sp. Gsoil 351]
MGEAPAYQALKARRMRIYHLEHLQTLATWDRLTYMPRAAAEARGAAQAELAAVLQSLQAAPELDGLFTDAANEPLAPSDRENFKLMERDRRLAAAVPDSLVALRAEATAAAAQAWSEARAANDWAQFAPALDALLAIVREVADRIGDALGVGRYDALLDGFDPGLRSATVERWFREIGEWLPGTIRAIMARQSGREPQALQAPFDLERQRQACVAAMELLGFDFAKGRLDISAHPFTAGTPEDVRVTTRFAADDCLQSLLAVIHETGHARYQAGLPQAWRGQPLGEPCSASMHEAQALIFERQLARRPAFVRALSSILDKALGSQRAFLPDNLQRLLTRVAPGRIRVEADEVTYAAHVILRTRIEAALIAGDIGADDVPLLWSKEMQSLLGVDTERDALTGPLQDIHWSQGMFGYFPAYLIGAMIAAQLFARFAETSPALDEDGPKGFRKLGSWLDENVWSRGAALNTEELVKEISGKPLSPAALRAHIEQRYGCA